VVDRPTRLTDACRAAPAQSPNKVVSGAFYAPRMTLPHDRTTLHEQVDERYHYTNPTAPYTIDPDDPAHRQWVDVWIEIRDEVLIAATNQYLVDQYPDAPRQLDPNDPAQDHYVKEWLRIRDEILGDGVTTPNSDPAMTTDEPAPATPAEPSADQFDREADHVRDYLKGALEMNQLPTDAPPVQFIDEQLDVARSLYLGRHFDRHDEWTSTTRDFDTGVGFNNLGVQVRVVGTDRSLRMGLVGDGPSDVGGWQGYPGAATQ
jgi:hypothetical protein